MVFSHAVLKPQITRINDVESLLHSANLSELNSALACTRFVTDYCTQRALISRKPQMTLITLIIWSTEFKLIAQIASCCALAASGMLVNYNENVDENGLRIITNY